MRGIYSRRGDERQPEGTLPAGRRLIGVGPAVVYAFPEQGRGGALRPADLAAGSMERVRTLAVAGALAWASALAPPALAEADGPDSFRVVGVPSGHSLGLRTGPGLLFPIAGALPANAVNVKNLGCKGGLSFAEWQRASARERAASVERRWCRVRFGNVTGWAHGKNLREDEHAH